MRTVWRLRKRTRVLWGMGFVLMGPLFSGLPVFAGSDTCVNTAFTVNGVDYECRAISDPQLNMCLQMDAVYYPGGALTSEEISRHFGAVAPTAFSFEGSRLNGENCSVCCLVKLSANASTH